METKKATKHKTKNSTPKKHKDPGVETTFHKIRKIISSIPKSSVYFVALLIGIFVQHRFWLFGNIYSNPGSRVTGQGDGYYTLGIFMQNTLNLIEGMFFSLNGDHHTWWSFVIGVTAHAWAASSLFAPLYYIIQNPVLLYNILFFGNLILLQIGVFLLVRKYTSNHVIAILGALLVPLSQAFLTFYNGHIHASYYWFLPYITLIIDDLFDPLKIKIPRWKLVLNYTGLAYMLYWLIYSDWHVTVFAAIWIGIWSLFKTKLIFTNFSFFKWRLLTSIGIGLSIVVSAIPLVLGVLAGSETFNTIRTLGDVNGTIFDTHTMMGYRYILLPLFQLGIELTGPGSQLYQQLIRMYPIIQQGHSTYPDLITISTFWICSFLFIPWTLILMFKKGSFYPRAYALSLIVLVTVAIITGPFPKVGGEAFFQIKLPYYYIRQIYFPLQAIRGLWRGAMIAFLASIVLLSFVVSYLWEKLAQINIKPFVRYSIAGYLVIASFFGMFLLNQGFEGNGFEAIEYSSELESSLDTVANEPFETFIWRVPGPWAQSRSDYYHFQFSYYNLKKQERIVNWVAGGTAGTSTGEYVFIYSIPESGNNLDLLVEILAAKEVDVIIQELKKPLSPIDYLATYPEFFNESEDLLSEYYTPIHSDSQRVFWKLDKRVPAENLTPNLSYSIQASDIQNKRNHIDLYVNYENLTDKLWVNSEVAKPEEVRIELVQDGEVRQTHVETVGSPVFMPQYQGLSHYLQFPLNRSKPGDGELKMYINEQEVASKNITIMENREYLDLVQQLQQQQPTIDPNAFNQIYHTGYPDVLYLIPVPLTIRVENGIIDNQGKEVLAERSDKIYANFFELDSDNVVEPFAQFQPPCTVPFNLVRGDSVTIWCTQKVPKDLDSEYRVRPELKTDLY